LMGTRCLAHGAVPRVERCGERRRTVEGRRLVFDLFLGRLECAVPRAHRCAWLLAPFPERSDAVSGVEPSRGGAHRLSFRPAARRSALMRLRALRFFRPVPGPGIHGGRLAGSPVHPLWPKGRDAPPFGIRRVQWGSNSPGHPLEDLPHRPADWCIPPLPEWPASGWLYRRHRRKT